MVNLGLIHRDNEVNQRPNVKVKVPEVDGGGAERISTGATGTAGGTGVIGATGAVNVGGSGGTSLLQACTVNEVAKAQTNKVRLARLKGELVDRPQAMATFSSWPAPRATPG